jgi:uncharacterized protein (TIGR04255 family)
MSSTVPPKIEHFPHLPRAPIVEAVIHWQAPSAKAFDQTQVQEEVKRRFPEYGCQAQQELRAIAQTSPEGVQSQQQARWDGFRLTGKGIADRYVAQFKPNGVVFSRLAPYQSWEPFEAEALRFWDAYVELASPPVVQRLGVRFINQIMLGVDREASYFLKQVPAPPPGIGLSSDQFFHQDTFRVSESPYQINWIRTVQTTLHNERVLILDTDVSTEGIDSSRDVLLTHLAEMRLLKNRVFFACMTQQAINQFRKDSDE